MSEDIKFVCSLGFNCHPAEFLKTNNLKLASYPFDWIMSNIDVVKHCLEDDFKTFLDRSCYTNLNRSDRCGHSVYCNNMFVHHNPLHKQEDYDYFVRCVERFRHLLSKTEKKLFIISVINGEHKVGSKLSEEVRKQVMELNDVIKTKTTNYELLFLVNYPNKSGNNFILSKNDNVTFLEIDTISMNYGTKYHYENDNIYLYELFKKEYECNIHTVM